MLDHTTIRRSRAWALATCVATTCACSPGVADPRALAESSPPPVFGPFEVDIEPAVGQLAGLPRIGAAPLAEPDRASQPDAARLMVAFGSVATQELRGSLEGAIGEALTGCVADVVVSGDHDAVAMVAAGRVDAALIGMALPASAREGGLREQLLGVELFGLAVRTDSPIRTLTKAQVRQALTGEVLDWSALGLGGGTVDLVVPGERKVKERAARTLIPGDCFSAAARHLDDAREVAAELTRNAGAIAVVRVTSLTAPRGLRFVEIDWAEPSAESFVRGIYPYGVPMNLVTAGDPDAQIRAAGAFVRSPAGQSLLGRALLLHR